MDCNSCQLPPPVPVVSRTHHKDAKLSQGEMPIVQEVAWAKGKGKAFKSFFTPFTHTHTKTTKVQMHEPLRSTSSRIVSFNPRDNMAQAWLAQAPSRTQNALATARECKKHEAVATRKGRNYCLLPPSGWQRTCQQKIHTHPLSGGTPCN